MNPVNLRFLAQGSELTEQEPLPMETGQTAPSDTPTLDDLATLLTSLNRDARKEKWEEIWQQILLTAKRFNETAPIDAQLFAMIHGGPIIKNSSYEGIDPGRSASFLIQMLKLIKVGDDVEQKEIQSLIHDLTKFVTLYKKIIGAHSPSQKTQLAREISVEVAALQPGMRLLIPGGIRGDPGHFVLYEVLRDSFRIYNTGVDIGEAQPQIDKNGKTYYFPYHEIAEVPAENIQSVPFYRILFDLYLRENVRPELSFKNIVQRIRMMLRGKCHSLTLDSHSMAITTHPTGICGWEPFISYGKARLGIHYFKQLYFQIKFWSIPQSYLRFENSKPSQSERELLTRSTYALAKRPEKIYGIPTEANAQINSDVTNDLIHVHTLLQHVLEWLKSFEIKPSSFKQPSVPLVQTSMNQRLLVFTSKNFALRIFSKVENEIKARRTEKDLTSAQFTFPKSHTLLKDLKNWNKHLLSLFVHHEEQAKIKIEQLLQHLPIPIHNEFWNSIDDQKLQDIFVELMLTANIYLRSAKGKNNEKYRALAINLYHLYSILDHLMVKISQEAGSISFAPYGIAVPRGWFFFQNDVGDGIPLQHVWPYQDFRDQHRLNLIENYFKQRNTNKTKLLFRYESLEVNQDTWKSSADFEIIRAYLERDSVIERKIIEKEKLSKGGLTRPFFMAYVFTRTQPSEESPLPLAYYKMREFHQNLTDILEDFQFPKDDTKGSLLKHARQADNIFTINDVYTSISLLAGEDKIYISGRKNSPKNIHHDLATFLHLSHQYDIPLFNSLEGMVALYGGHSSNQGLYLRNKTPPSFIRHQLQGDESIDLRQLSRMIDIRTLTSLSISLCLRLYLENLDLLASQTHRDFLWFNLFERNRLLALIQNDSEIIALLKKFTESAARCYFKDPEKVTITLYLIDLFHALDTLHFIVPDLDVQFLPLNPTRKVLEQLMNCFSADPNSEYYGFLAHRMIHIHANKPTFNQEDVWYILKAWFVLTTNDQYQNALSQAKGDFYAIEMKLAEILNQADERDPILNALAQETVPSLRSADPWRGEYPDYQNSSLSIHLLSGQIFENEVGFAYLPVEIRKLDYIKKQFHIGPQDLFRRKGKKYISQEKAMKIVIDPKHGVVRLQKKTPEGWATYLKDVPVPPALLEKRYAWFYPGQDKEDFVQIEDKRGKSIYRISFIHKSYQTTADVSAKKSTNDKSEKKRKAEEKKKEVAEGRHAAKENYSNFVITECATGYQLIHWPSSKGIDHYPILKKLCQIESPENILVWVDPETELITRIEFARYQLSFTATLAGFACDQMNGLRLVSEGYYSPFRHFSVLVALKSNEDKTFFLIANQPFAHELPIAAEPLIRPIEKLKHDKAASHEQLFFLYEVDEDKEECIASSLESRMHLVYLYILDGNPLRALRLLERCWKNEPFTPEELEHLKRILTYSDDKLAYPNPEYAALASAAACLILKNKGWKPDYTQFPTDLLFLYERYIKVIPSLTEKFKLTLSQEKDIIKILKDYSYEVKGVRTPLLDTRPLVKLHALSLERESVDAQPKKLEFQPLSLYYDNSYFDYQAENLHMDQILTENVIVKGDSTFKILFIDFFEAFLGDDLEKKAWYYNLLICASQGGWYQQSLLFLWAYPERFKAFLNERKDITLTLENRDKIFHQFIGTLNQDEIKNLCKKLHDQILDKNFPALDIQQKLLSPTTSLRLVPPFFAASQVQPMHVDAVTKPKRSTRIEIEPFSYEALFHAYFDYQVLKLNENLPVSLQSVPRPSPIMDRIRRSPRAQELYTQTIGTVETDRFKLDHYKVHDEKLNSLDALKNQLLRRHEQLISFVRTQEKEILELANHSPLNHDGTLSLAELQQGLRKKLNQMAGKEKQITIEGLIICILQRDFQFADIQNPYLDQVKRRRLHTQMIRYLSIRCEIQKINRIIEALEALRKHQPVEDKNENQAIVFSLVKKVKEAMLAQTEYDIDSHPHLLAFEFLNDMIYRKKQTELLIRALERRKGNIAFGLSMGQGKTIRLLPSLGLMLSTGEHVVVIVVPEQHLEQTYNILDQTCQVAAGKRVTLFKFHRNSGATVSNLEKIYASFLESKEAKGIILTTRESLEAFFLAGNEQMTTLINTPPSMLKDQKTQSLVASVKVFSAIIRLMQEGKMIGDEIHHLLKSLYELNFTYGKGIPLLPNRWTVCLKTGEILARLNYLFDKPFNILLDPEALREWKIVKKTMTTTLFEENFRPHLDEEVGDHILDYLHGKKVEVTPILQLFQVNPELALSIVIAKEQLNSFLPYCLSKEWNVFFGLSKENPFIEYAIPYLGSDTPNEGSEFHNYFIMINFTIMTYMRIGLNEKKFTPWLVNLKNQRTKEQSLNIKQEKGSRLERMEREVFKGDLSIFEANLHDKHVLAPLVEKYGKHPLVVLDYLNTAVFPTYKIHSKKLSANPQVLFDYMFGMVIGLTGTPYNIATQKFDECAFDEDGSVSVISTMMRRKNQLVTILQGTTPKEIIEEIATYAEADPKMSALIDNGALLKGLEPLEAAKILRDKLTHLKGIVIFDGKAKKTGVLKRNGSSAEPLNPQEIREQERFALYDHRNAFGAHLTHPSNAVGGLTIDKFSALYQILQAAIRMREAEQMQGIRYFLLNYLADTLKALTGQASLIGYDILLMGILNETEQFEKELIASTTQRIVHIPRKKLYQHAGHALDWDLNSLFDPHFVKAWNSIVVEDVPDDPFHTYLEPLSTEDPHKLFARFGETLLHEQEYFKGEEREEMEKVIAESCQKLPARIQARSLKDFQQEVEKQEEKNVETEGQTFNQDLDQPAKEMVWGPQELISHIFQHLEAGLQPTFNFKPPNAFVTGGSFGTVSINAYLEHLGYPPIFTPHLRFSYNFLITAENHSLDFSMKWRAVDYFLEFKPAARFNSSSQFILISLEEAEKLETFFNQQQLSFSSFQLNLRDIHGNCWASCTSEDFVENENSLHELKNILVQLMFLDGREYYPSTMENELFHWMSRVNEQSHLKRMSDLLFKLHQNRHPKKEIGAGNFFTLQGKISRQGLL